MLTFLKKKLHNKIVVAIAIPHTKEQFYSVFKRGNSDFMKSIESLYKTNDCDTLWNKYSVVASIIQKSLNNYAARGAEIVEQLTKDKLNCISNADIAIIIAHHSNIADELEMADKMVSIEEFVNSVPLEFAGVLDMSSCYSTTSQLYIKMRCPKSHVIANDNKISLQQRMVVYDYVIKTLCDHKDMDYIDAIKSAFSILFTMQKQGESVNHDILYLGGEILSSVYAPKQVEKGQSFLIQVAIHKKSDSEDVEIMAREADGSTSLRNPLRLKLHLKNDDKVDLALKIENVNREDFIVKRTRDFFYWQNEPVFKSFTVYVAEQCKSKSCIAKILINVNKIPAGTITFVSEIADAPVTNVMSADIYMEGYDKRREMDEAKVFLLKQMRAELDNLINQPTENTDDKANSIRDIEICKNSIKLLEENHGSKTCNDVFKVFISSTSDLSSFRNVMKERVLNCMMYPEMYESWPQKEKYPRDYCIERVLSSDIFVCILGPNYGYVEPAINSSMTEIEFRVALFAGKPMLIYVWDEYEKTGTDRQKALIKELDTKRMVEFFKDEIGLALISSRELTLLQKELEYERPQ